MLLKFGFRIFALVLIVFLLGQFPGIIKLVVTLFQAVGAVVVAMIKTQPIFFAVGFLLMYGLAKAK